MHRVSQEILPQGRPPERRHILVLMQNPCPPRIAGRRRRRSPRRGGRDYKAAVNIAGRVLPGEYWQESNAGRVVPGE
ncbi:uncharacterized protein AruCF_2761 [Achromobacter ruhlandii]|nr:uncharacterized protein AruCF_2761 [Achromobacter ruhlandii]